MINNIEPTGPVWLLHRGEDYAKIYAPRLVGADRMIVEIKYPGSQDIANFRLIRSAPKLFALLKMLCDADAGGGLDHEMFAEARAAIAEAEGRE